MKKREIDSRCRNKDYTAEIALNHLPANDKQMSDILSFLDYVRERKDVSVLMRIHDDQFEDDVPQAVLLAQSGEGFYMELTYAMGEWGWNHPLLLAHDHLSKEEAQSVLTSIFRDCTDDNPIVSENFGEISSAVFPEESKEENTAVYNAQEEPEIRILNPCMSIDIDGILDSWMKEWNETPETNTEEWKLTAFPVLADGRVALLFESEILEYGADEEGELTGRTIENHYRVLVYDPKNAGQVDRFRFKIYGGYAATIFFKEGKLFAPVSETGKSQYTALHVWPGSDDEHQILIGDDINCLAATDAGDIIVSYNRGNDLREETEDGLPLISIFRTDGTQQDIPCFFEEDTGEPSGDFVIDVTLDTQERIWAMLSDAETAVVYDRDGSITSYSLPVSDVSALAVPKDSRCIYASSEDEKEGCILFRIPMTTEDEEDEEPALCAVRTPEGDALTNQGCSFLKNIMAVIIDNVLYIIDLDGQ